MAIQCVFVSYVNRIKNSYGHEKYFCCNNLIYFYNEKKQD